MLPVHPLLSEAKHTEMGKLLNDQRKSMKALPFRNLKPVFCYKTSSDFH